METEEQVGGGPDDPGGSTQTPGSHSAWPWPRGSSQELDWSPEDVPRNGA